MGDYIYSLGLSIVCQDLFDGPAFYEAATDCGPTQSSIAAPFRNILDFAIKSNGRPSPSNRSRECIAQRPCFQSLMEQAARDSKLSRPGRHTLRFAFKCDRFSRARPNGNEDSVFGCPSAFQAICKYGMGYAPDSRPFCQSMSYTIRRNAVIAALVVLLRGWRDPTTILWRVRAIIINAAQGMTKGTWPHVLREGAKTINPRLTDCDAASSIKRKTLAMGIKTPILHTEPGLVFARVTFPVHLVHGCLLRWYQYSTSTYAWQVFNKWAITFTP